MSHMAVIQTVSRRCVLCIGVPAVTENWAAGDAGPFGAVLDGRCAADGPAGGAFGPMRPAHGLEPSPAGVLVRKAALEFEERHLEPGCRSVLP